MSDQFIQKEKLTELRGEIDNSIVLVRDFNMSLSIMDKTTRKKMSMIQMTKQDNKPTRSNKHIKNTLYNNR